eukprot:1192705-Prorocentrum_minimum.AAC.2
MTKVLHASSNRTAPVPLPAHCGPANTRNEEKPENMFRKWLKLESCKPRLQARLSHVEEVYPALVGGFGYEQRDA